MGEIEIYGKIWGNVYRKKRVVIHATGQIQGEVHTPVLVAEEGGILDGNINMVGDGKSEEIFESSAASQKEWPDA